MSSKAYSRYTGDLGFDEFGIIKSVLFFILRPIVNLFIYFIYVLHFSDQFKVSLMILYTKLQKLLTKT